MATSLSGAGQSSTSTPEYVTLRKCYKAVIDLVKEQSGAFCDALFAAGYIPPSVRDYTRNDFILDEKKAQRLVDTVIDRIEHNPSVYHGFVKVIEGDGPWTKDILQRLQKCYEAECTQATQLPQPREDDGHSSGDESFHSATDNLDEPGFVCPHCGECSLNKFFSEEGCPKKKVSPKMKTLFPFLNVSTLDEGDRIDLEGQLISDTSKMITRFADFTLIIKQSIEDRAVPLKRVIDSVLSLKAFTEDIGVKLLNVMDKEKIQAASCLSDVFITLRDYISFFNYQIIEHLIKHHGSPDDHKKLEEYISALATFCQRNVFEIPPKVFCTKSRRSGKVFALKCTESVTTLENVQGVKRQVAEVFGLQLSALQLCSIAKGCVELCFFISTAIAERILPVSPSHQLALSEIRVRVLSGDELAAAGEEEEEDRIEQWVQSSVHQSVTSHHSPSTVESHSSPPPHGYMPHTSHHLHHH